MLLIAADAPPKFATLDQVNNASSNKVVVIGGNNATVAKTATNGTIYYAVSASGGGGGGAVNYADFYGTNGNVVRTNPSTSKIIIGPTEPISTIASNAAIALVVWTNAEGVIRPAGVVPSTNIQLHFSNTNDGNTGWAALFEHYPTGNGNFSGTQIRVPAGDFTGHSGIAFDVQNFAGGPGSFGAIFDAGAFFGTDSTMSYDNGGTNWTAGEGAGVSGTGLSSFSLQYGVTGLGSPNTTGTGTNIGVSGLGAMDALRGKTNGVFIGLVGQLSRYWYGINAVNPLYESAACFLETRDTGLPVLVAKTNGGYATVINEGGSAIFYGGVAILGFNAAVGKTLTCTNATTGESEWTSASQTPWLSDIDGDNKALTNVNSISFAGNSTLAFTDDGTKVALTIAGFGDVFVFQPDGTFQTAGDILGGTGTFTDYLSAGGTVFANKGTVEAISVLDTNGMTSTKLYTQGGTLYSSASPPNQTVAVEEWAVMSGRTIVSGIDGKSVGNTTLAIVPTGRQLLVQQIILIPTTVDTLAVAATASVGKTSAAYIDVVAATVLTGLTTVNSSMILTPVVNANVLQSGESLVLRVSSGATATTFTFKALVIGLLL